MDAALIEAAKSAHLKTHPGNIQYGTAGFRTRYFKYYQIIRCFFFVDLLDNFSFSNKGIISLIINILPMLCHRFVT